MESVAPIGPSRMLLYTIALIESDSLWLGIDVVAMCYKRDG
jgi:hypothetical protein